MADKEVVVLVKRLVPLRDLDPDDRTSSGKCAVEGKYLVPVTESQVEAAARRLQEEGDTFNLDPVIEAALTEFHKKVAIGNLDNHRINTRLRSETDLPGSFDLVL